MRNAIESETRSDYGLSFLHSMFCSPTDQQINQTDKQRKTIHSTPTTKFGRHCTNRTIDQKRQQWTKIKIKNEKEVVEEGKIYTQIRLLLSRFFIVFTHPIPEDSALTTLHLINGKCNKMCVSVCVFALGVSFFVWAFRGCRNRFFQNVHIPIKRHLNI